VILVALSILLGCFFNEKPKSKIVGTLEVHRGTNTVQQQQSHYTECNKIMRYKGMRPITTFRLTTDRIYDGGTIRYNIIIPLCYNCLQYSVQ